MESPNIQSPRCQVTDAGKLPDKSGGANALCAAIESAVSARAPGVAFTVDVRVISASRLAANVTRAGKPLPKQQFAIMDRELGEDSFGRFAAAIADQIAKAGE